MNYRVLFIISILILLVGLGGLFMIPNQSEQTVATTTETDAPAQPQQQEKKTVKMVMANRDLPPGSILKQDDYQINEIQIEDGSVLANDDVTDMLAQNSNSLNGFLVSEKTVSGRFVPKNTLISPTDERFLFYTVGKDEVVYRVYIRLENQFVLDTLKSGDIVSIYSQQEDFSGSNGNQPQRFDSILQNLEVVKIDRFDNSGAEGAAPVPDQFKDYAGYVSVRMKADAVKDLLTLNKNRSLVVLPQGDLIERNLNKRGLAVRNLRAGGN